MASWRDLRQQSLQGVTREAVSLVQLGYQFVGAGRLPILFAVQFDLIRSHGGAHIATGTRDLLDVALLVHRHTVFVGRKISRQIYWFAAKFTGYVWERVTTHNASFGRSQVA
jgi:hypothetical protein